MANKSKRKQKEVRKQKAEFSKKRPQTEYQRTRDLEKRRHRKGSNGLLENID